MEKNKKKALGSWKSIIEFYEDQPEGDTYHFEADDDLD